MELPRLQIRGALLTRWTFSDIVLSERNRRSRAAKEDAMEKPVIGVVPLWDDEKNSIWMLPDYLNSLRAAGAVPVIFPLDADESDIQQLYALCDGLLFTGGHDADPALYGQEKSSTCGTICASRDKLEAGLFRLGFADHKPMLGICRGCQMFNVFLGGTLYQDLPSELPSDIFHRMTAPYDRAIHTVTLAEGGRLQKITGCESLGVNSFHHQGICNVAPALQAEAYAPDGLVESVSCSQHPFLLGVQWHPEYLKSSPSSAALFQAFVKSCQ